MAIRQALPEDADSIKACAYDAYSHYVERMGKDPAPMVADFESQIEQGIVYVSSDDENNIQGFIVFYPKNDHVHLARKFHKFAQRSRSILISQGNIRRSLVSMIPSD